MLLRASCFDDIETAICSKCREEYAQLPFDQGRICYACKLADEVLERAQNSCAEVEHYRFMMSWMPDVQKRLNKRGFDCELVEPTWTDMFKGRLRLKVKAVSQGCCKGPAGAVNVESTPEDGLPTPRAVASERASACTGGCPVKTLDPHTLAIKALTKRCAAAITTIKADAVRVPLRSADIPALLGTIRNIENSGWKASIVTSNSYFRFGEIAIYPSA